MPCRAQSGWDADLLDVRRLVDVVEQQLADRQIVGVDRDEGTAVGGVWRHLRRCAGIVVGR
jgi:hypothetical protein